MIGRVYYSPVKPADIEFIKCYCQVYLSMIFFYLDNITNPAFNYFDVINKCIYVYIWIDYYYYYVDILW